MDTQNIILKGLIGYLLYYNDGLGCEEDMWRIINLLTFSYDNIIDYQKTAYFRLSSPLSNFAISLLAVALVSFSWSEVKLSSSQCNNNIRMLLEVITAGQSTLNMLYSELGTENFLSNVWNIQKIPRHEEEIHFFFIIKTCSSYHVSYLLWVS